MRKSKNSVAAVEGWKGGMVGGEVGEIAGAES